jgi:hypothetical protein
MNLWHENQMKLYLQYGEALSGQWENLCEIELKSLETGDSHPPTEAKNVLGIHLVPVKLPNDEILSIDITYSIDNRGISISVSSEGITLIQVGGFKKQATSYDPNVLFLTPKGLYISIMVGN